MPLTWRLPVFALACCLGWQTPKAHAACSPINAGVSTRYFLEGVRPDIEYEAGLRLDAYAPPGDPRPAALLIHGSTGDKSTHLTQLLPLLANAGYAWFSVNYRNIADINAAIAFIECPGRFPVQRRLLLIGEDTGVSFAVELANRNRAAFTGVIGFGAAKNVAGMTDPHIPTTLFHGASDTDSDPKPLEKACQAWATCRFILIPKGIHNIENWHPDEWEWKEEFTGILRNGKRGLWKDIVYSRPGGLPLTMDANLPEGNGPFPAVVVVHGGGWEAGDKTTYVGPLLSLLSRTHFAYFSIDYRLTPYVRNEQQLDDLRNAIRYIREHAGRFDVDPNAIAIAGESAGGQIVTQVASVPCSGCEVQAVISFYGVYDFVPWSAKPDSKPMLDRIFGKWSIEELRRYSPISHVHAGMPPVLLVQGTADELYNGSITYEKRLKQEGIPHEVILLKGAPHGMENWVGRPEWEIYQPKLIRWLNSVLQVHSSSQAQ